MLSTEIISNLDGSGMWTFPSDAEINEIAEHAGLRLVIDADPQDPSRDVSHSYVDMRDDGYPPMLVFQSPDDRQAYAVNLYTLKPTKGSPIQTPLPKHIFDKHMKLRTDWKEDFEREVCTSRA